MVPYGWLPCSVPLSIPKETHLAISLFVPKGTRLQISLFRTKRNPPGNVPFRTQKKPAWKCPFSYPKETRLEMSLFVPKGTRLEIGFLFKKKPEFPILSTPPPGSRGLHLTPFEAGASEGSLADFAGLPAPSVQSSPVRGCVGLRELLLLFAGLSVPEHITKKREHPPLLFSRTSEKGGKPPNTQKRGKTLLGQKNNKDNHVPLLGSPIFV